MNKERVVDKLKDIIDSAYEKQLKCIVEATIESCSMPNCIVCTSLREAMNEESEDENSEDYGRN